MTSRSGIQLVREKSYWQLDKRKSSRLNGLAQRAQCWIWTFISYFALHCCVGGDFAFTWNKVWLLNERVYSEPEGHILYYTTALEKRNLYSVYMYISSFFFLSSRLVCVFITLPRMLLMASEATHFCVNARLPLVRAAGKDFEANTRRHIAGGHVKPQA